MKRIFTLAFVLFSLLITAGVTSSCDFDVHEDPDHPLYVEYTISAGDISFSGPEQLKIDNQAMFRFRGKCFRGRLRCLFC